MTSPVRIEGGCLGAVDLSHWSPDGIIQDAGNHVTTVRLLRRKEEWESEGIHVECTLRQFHRWSQQLDGRSASDRDSPIDPDCADPFAGYCRDDYAAYMDYKNVFDLRRDVACKIRWSTIAGVPAHVDGEQARFWWGTQGCTTRCHYDSYGSNFVMQLYGTKRWTLVEPHSRDSARLHSTRLPYEESSIFAASLPTLPTDDEYRSETGTMVFDLEPGDLLYVPRHWWHQVETTSASSVSVNLWVDHPLDAHERVHEAIVRTLVCGLKGGEHAPGIDARHPHRAGPVAWLNTGEQYSDTHDNSELLTDALASAMPTLVFSPDDTLNTLLVAATQPDVVALIAKHIYSRAQL